MRQFPRACAETSPSLTQEEGSDLLASHWRCQGLNVRPANARCVYYVELAEGRRVFRSTPGWDGPTPPSRIVGYSAHLSRCQAPVPHIFPAREGALSKPYRDFTLSVEGLLPGQHLSSTQPETLDAVGQGLACLHRAATSFAECPSQWQPVRGYVDGMFSRSLARPLAEGERAAVTLLCQHVQADYSSILDQYVPWILCRGDVHAGNTLVTAEGEVGFTDFNSAEYAPALWEVVMTRFQWLGGQSQGRLLEVSEAADLVRGYHRERPLEESEVLAFSAVWSADYTERLTFLHNQWEAQSPNRSRWQVQERILRLPLEAVEMGQELVKAVGLCGGR